MGWGAAQAFYEENADWCASPEEAHEILYPATAKPKRPILKKAKCQTCGKKVKKAGLTDHMRDVHGAQK